MVRVSPRAERVLIVGSRILARLCCGGGRVMDLEKIQYWPELLITVVAWEDKRAVAAGNK